MTKRELAKKASEYVNEVSRWWNVTAEDRARADRKVLSALMEIEAARRKRDQAVAARASAPEGPGGEK